MNRDERREAEKDLMKQSKQELLTLFYELLGLVGSNELKMEEFETHKTLIKKVWKKKFKSEILLDEIITSED